jgi:hypothetical protein
METSFAAARKRKAAEMDIPDPGEDEDGAMEEGAVVPTTKVRKMRRPEAGEVLWWRTSFTVNPEVDADRLDAYGWEEVGGELRQLNACR